LGFGLAHEIVAAHKLSADLQTAHCRGRLHNRAHRGDAGAMNITIAEVTAAQELGNALEIRAAQRAREMVPARHDLLTLRIG
jgi:hypothetical protein